MKVSVITPTHRVSNYLLELYNTLKEQTYSDWEWVLWLNNGVTLNEIPSEIQLDHQVYIYEAHHYIQVEDLKYVDNVGLHKKYAFSLATGDILLEADHDDLLTTDCLAEVISAFSQPQVGFVYSNDAKLHSENGFVPYNSDYGWRHTQYNYKGETLWAPISFPASSHSLVYIWYSPDHVRAWRTEVYNQVGGHNKALNVLDDQELLIKTYLTTEFYHINKVLYIYRITGKNTWLERNKEIQEGTIKLCNKYAQKLAERDANKAEKLKVNLGGGLEELPGYLNIDLHHGQIKVDLRNGIPLPDNSVGVIIASHIIEHLPDPIKTMSEIHRVLHHGGWVFIDVPSTDGRGAFQDPTHCSFWNENSFLYYTNKEQAFYINNNHIKFQVVRCETIYPNEWYQSKHIPVVRAWLICIKSDFPRFPGLLHI